MTHVYVTYNRFTSDLKTHRDGNWCDREANEKGKEGEVATLTSDRTDF